MKNLLLKSQLLDPDTVKCCDCYLAAPVAKIKKTLRNARRRLTGGPVVTMLVDGVHPKFDADRGGVDGLDSVVRIAWDGGAHTIFDDGDAVMAAAVKGVFRDLDELMLEVSSWRPEQFRLRSITDDYEVFSQWVDDSTLKG